MSNDVFMYIKVLWISDSPASIFCPNLQPEITQAIISEIQYNQINFHRTTYTRSHVSICYNIKQKFIRRDFFYSEFPLYIRTM